MSIVVCTLFKKPIKMNSFASDKNLDFKETNHE